MGPRRTFGDRGATAVEAAIVTPLVLMLLFGIVELGFFFKDYLAAAGAVRAGVRIASAMPRNTMFAQAAADQVALSGGAMNLQDVQELWVYKVGLDTTAALTNTPIGFSNFDDCSASACVRFSWVGGTFVKKAGYDWPALEQDACSTTNERPDRIGVYIKLKHDAFTGFVFKTIYISEASIMSLEPISFLTACKPPPLS